jgi:hypothetical protein
MTSRYAYNPRKWVMPEITIGITTGMKRAAFFVLGFISFVIGSAILAWCAYGFFMPDDQFRFQLVEVPKMLLPAAMIWVGWSWMRGEPRQSATTYDSEIELTLELTGSDFGTAPERQKILQLKHRLEQVLAEGPLGEIDGEEFGDGECTIFIQTNSPPEVTNVIQTFLRSEGIERYTLGTTPL